MKKDERWWGGYGTAVYLGGWILVVSARHDELFGLSLNELGDFLAGSFGPIAFGWLVLGYMQQGKELKVSSDALRLQADELRSSVEAQRELVEVSRAQVQAELESAAASERHRATLLKPFFTGASGGGSHSGGIHKLRFSVRNLGAPVSRVVFGFQGDFASATKSVDAIDKGDSVPFEVEFEGSGEGLGDILQIVWFDADMNTGEALLAVRVDTSGEWPRIHLSPHF